jgi:lysine-N-methylase
MKQIHPVKTVKLTVPKYVKDFKCIGNECPDTCCAGWRVTIDKSTYNAYKKISEPVLEKKMRLHVARDRKSNNDSSYAYIKLNEDRACPFLEEKLCSVQANKGGEYLSNTCHSYPRITKNVSGRLEQQLTLSCPEAARLALTMHNAFELVEIETKERIDIIETSVNSKTISDSLTAKIRASMLMIAQNEKLSHQESIMILGIFFEELEKLINERKTTLIEAVIIQLLNSIDNGLFKYPLKKIHANQQYQVMLYWNLFKLKREHKATKFFKDFITINPKNEEQVLEQIETEFFINKISLFNSPKYSKIFKNYISNEILTGSHDFTKNSPMELLSKIAIKLGTITFSLATNESINIDNDDLTINTIQRYTKEYEHDASYNNNVLELIKSQNLHNLKNLEKLLII